jgi:two-component sensor histidine kinase
MSLHELATNAARHGALATPDGAVHVRWSAGADDEIDIIWSESGGRRIESVPVEGAGLRLVHGLVEYELRGSVAIEFETRGVICRVTVRPAVLAK